MNGSDLPAWDLAPIYPGPESPEYSEAKATLARTAGELEAHLKRDPGKAMAAWLKKALALLGEANSKGETLQSYAYARYSTATGDASAMNELNAIEEMMLPLKACEVTFRNVIASRRKEVEGLAVSDLETAEFRYFLEEELFWQTKQMPPELEDLAEDLTRSGGDSWGRLQERISSNAHAVWDEATGEKKTVIELRNLAFDKDRLVREKAFRKELEVWESSKIPLAAALNGVKGFTVTLNKRRGWEGAIDKAIRQSRITGKTLEALIEAMKGAQPMFRRYLKAKAKLLGIPKCSFYDLFAPVGNATRTFTWAETRSFIIEKFGAFSPEMGDFARKAFDGRWIDAAPREGKVGGAYCTDFPDAKTSRILSNFEGSFSSLTTIAHELGHAYHHEVIKELPFLQTRYPMTLAETASIFAETVVFEDALKNCGDSERLGLVEIHLQDGCQIIQDILSRFMFETALFDGRSRGELSPEELCELMTDAQKQTYGDGLDESGLHPYMWAVKGHYYSTGLSFYNFPYAFGQLFGMGLYARYKEEGVGFATVYRDLLRETGRMSAVDVTRRAGFDIESVDFWNRGIAVFERQEAEFERLVAGVTA